MGKWSTYRRRGTTPPGGNALPAPPAPSLFDDTGFLSSTSQTNPNDDGILTLWWTPFEEPPEISSTQPWSLLGNNWGAITELDAGDWYVIEEGNGINYVGLSPPSNTFNVP
jgi:hypothetical protein